ncbi:hypothetical protein M5K25_020407 [Dendrobium thyrsiflorum]|uniref:Pentatricopeptide repeat-containing protein n=1 Tax=Dendrobium thyrsiflorum TaxID=117978 RepID=A0ABD0UGT9_DENTH
MAADQCDLKNIQKGILVSDGEIVPNELTVACVLGACASAGILRLGKCVHSYSLRNGIDVDGIVGNALIHMYSKCGAIGVALWIFGGLLYRDLVSWCTIIRGLATNGKPKHALQLFALMLCYGVRPDNIDFLAVMTACCHAGLIEEGLMFFRAMHEVDGGLPEKEHYTCIIDTYGRASCLKEAEGFFVGMPMMPNKCVWGALLSACKIHGVGEVVYDRIQKRVVHAGMTLGGGTYALLSNMLATTEKWDESNNARKELGTKRIRWSIKPDSKLWKIKSNMTEAENKVIRRSRLEQCVEHSKTNLHVTKKNASEMRLRTIYENIYIPLKAEIVEIV